MRVLFKKATKQGSDVWFKLLAASAAALVLVIIAGVFLSILIKSWPAIQKFGVSFFWSAEWNPVTGSFGAASSILGTLVSTFIAIVIAVPLSLAIAIFLVELAPPRIARPVSYAIELLAAIPSIIYGMWGLFVFAPFMSEKVQPLLQGVFGDWFLFAGPPMGIGVLTAGVILAFMVLPFTSAMMRDVFAMVPPVVKESAFGLGATSFEVIRQVTVRYGIKGLLGALFLGLGRAIGETMAVTFVIGNDHRLSGSLFAAGNTIASTLANEFTEASEPLYLSSLVYLGLVLLLLTLLIQVAASFWLKRLQFVGGGR